MSGVSQSNLSKICEFVLDGTHGSPERTDEGVPVLSAQNVIDGRLSFESARLTSFSEYEAFRRRVDLASGDVLLTIVGSIGRAAVVQEVKPAVFQRSVGILRPNSKKVNSQYLFHALHSPRTKHQLDRLTNKSSQAGIYLAKLKTVEIPLPPLEEQKRIAAILDKADALRRKRAQALQLTDQFLQSLFLDMFGDPVTNPKGWEHGVIGDLLLETQYGTSKKAGNKGRYPVLRMNNITPTGGWNFSELKYMDLEDSEIDRYTVQDGDILFNRTNSPDLVGKTAVYREAEPMAYAGYLVRGRVNENANPEYIAAYLNSVYGKRLLRSMCKSIIGMANINATEFRGIRIPKPPKSLQDDFARYTHTVHRHQKKLLAAASELDDLSGSLAQRAFRGEL